VSEWRVGGADQCQRNVRTTCSWYHTTVQQKSIWHALNVPETGESGSTSRGSSRSSTACSECNQAQPQHCCSWSDCSNTPYLCHASLFPCAQQLQQLAAALPAPLMLLMMMMEHHYRTSSWADTGSTRHAECRTRLATPGRYTCRVNGLIDGWCVRTCRLIQQGMINHIACASTYHARNRYSPLSKIRNASAVAVAKLFSTSPRLLQDTPMKALS